MDWKEMLGQLKNNPDLPAGEDAADAVNMETDSAPSSAKKDTLHVVIEKKGRKGKTATIIEGFTCSDEELQAVAGRLKKKLGVGGSARGGEILIQGDFRQRIADLLREDGYKVKGQV